MTLKKNTLRAMAFTAALVIGSLPLGAQEKSPGDAEPTVKATGKAPSEAIKGYWAPSKEGFIKMMLKSMGGGAELDDATKAGMEQMAEAMVGSMAFHFEAGVSHMVTPEGIETAKWKMTSEDAKTGNLKVKISKPDGSTEDGEAIVGKDKMILISPEEDMKIICLRITEEEFKKRKAAKE